MLCKKYIVNIDSGICEACMTCIDKIMHPCQHCGISLTHPDDTICGHCLRAPWPFIHTVIPLMYNEWLSKLLIDYKHHAKLSYGYNLTKILIPYLARYYRQYELPDMILPVPLFKAKLIKRGFNQTAIMAQQIGAYFNIKVFYGCKKVFDTQPQARMNRYHRTKNLRESFAINNMPNINSVAIVDDVVTTGNTALTIAKLLQELGVKNIHLWSIARAI